MSPSNKIKKQWWREGGGERKKDVNFEGSPAGWDQRLGSELESQILINQLSGEWIFNTGSLIT